MSIDECIILYRRIFFDIPFICQAKVIGYQPSWEKAYKQCLQMFMEDQCFTRYSSMVTGLIAACFQQKVDKVQTIHISKLADQIVFWTHENMKVALLCQDIESHSESSPDL